MLADAILAAPAAAPAPDVRAALADIVNLLHDVHVPDPDGTPVERLAQMAHDIARDALAKHSPADAQGVAWRDISTAPKGIVVNGTPRSVYFLAYCPDISAIDPSACLCICWWEPFIGDGCWYGEGDFETHPTHWMPLPAPPAADTQAGREG
ncbi:DUF551 domain-containing protein [Roseomonas sp. NAR14]|uniref:DUF551 domain-containing protein n=1 Tax=Roseomonas acroporae TaxID=2937791 RepID=A0A9X1YFE4_9PROT|nr:DUF551 domain-containing protein [Roseomonas acroporae]MCK8788120.1 DUF551 domain-containing protein [Roseomonas acroporae]